MERWPHQIAGVAAVKESIQAGVKRVCLTSPTGGGKSVMITDLLEWCIEQDMPAILYTNRKLLTEQLMKTLSSRGIRFGVRAAGFDAERDGNEPIQISSIQTEDARVWKSQKWLSHKSGMAIFDEAHMQKGPTHVRQMDLHLRGGASIVGVTATPVALSALYDNLVVAGVNSDLRRCGALVPCHVYAPTEMDTRRLVRKEKTGEFSIGEVRKEVWSQAVVGSVIENWRVINPDARPAILFAPGVPEAIECAKAYERIGVSAASIDGDKVYIRGEYFESDRQAREDCIAMLRDGRIKVLCNRFVMREGIDIPELYHGILATPFGSIQSYIQTVGRILRAYKSKTDCVLQDHGGNWWRHGSPNADRDWTGVWGLSDYQIVGQRLEKMRDKGEPEPICCPKCKAIRRAGVVCQECGYHANRGTRVLIERDGTLSNHTGPIMQERKVKVTPENERLWKSMYYRMMKAGKTFNQARGLFFHENKYWPPTDLPMMPTNQLDWQRKIKDVPKETLVKDLSHQEYRG
jgi:superfamily II DNA or RNA helicase